MPVTYHALIAVGAYAVAAVVLWALVSSRLVRYFGDTPDHRKVHQAIVPRIGGVGMVLAFLGILAFQAALPPEIWPKPAGQGMAALVFASLFLLGAGGLDDIRPVNFKLKFLLQFTLAGVLVLVLDQCFDNAVILGHRFDLGGFGPILSIFWIVAVMNALNIIDGIDGLAAGVALLAFAVVGSMAYANGDTAQVFLCLALAGVTSGFMRFNFSRAHRMFLGDTGSQFLGAVLALQTIRVQELPATGFSIFVPLFIVGYPLFDISVAMVRRFKCGHRQGLGGRLLRMFAADNEHLHHRLVYLGMSHAQSTFLLLMVAGGIGATAVIISRIGWPWKPMVMAYLAGALLLVLNRLGYLGRRHWLTFPRVKPLPEKVVGVIEPDEVFMHSLTSYQQHDFEFLSIPGKLTQFMQDELVAVLLYNATSASFDGEWTKALRVAEVQDCPTVVIAEAKDIEKVKALNPDGFRSIHFVEKPVRVPELIRMLNNLSRSRMKRVESVRSAGQRPFSLARLASRNRRNRANV